MDKEERRDSSPSEIRHLTSEAAVLHPRELHGQTSASFNDAATPPRQRQPLSQRIRDLETRHRDHVERHRERFIARRINQLTHQRTAPQQAPTPAYAQDRTGGDPATVYRHAAHAYKSAMNRRYERIQSIGRRYHNVMRNSARHETRKQETTETMKKFTPEEVQAKLDQSKAEWMKAAEQFAADGNQKALEEARKKRHNMVNYYTNYEENFAKRQAQAAEKEASQQSTSNAQAPQPTEEMSAIKFIQENPHLLKEVLEKQYSNVTVTPGNDQPLEKEQIRTPEELHHYRTFHSAAIEHDLNVERAKHSEDSPLLKHAENTYNYRISQLDIDCQDISSRISPTAQERQGHGQSQG